MMKMMMALQAQHVSGLPAAAEGRQILVRLLHQQEQEQEQEQKQEQEQEQQETTASARCEAGGLAAFHGQVLLLHCAPVNRMVTSLAVITVSFHLHNHEATASGVIDLAAQLHRPTPSVLSFVLGVGAAVLTLTLHHRLVPRRPHSSCLPLPIPDCLRKTEDPMGVTKHNKEEEEDDQSSSGFITIEKGTISRRRPPSDNLLTTDDDEGDGGKPTTTMALAEELEVEDEFLAKLEAADHQLDLEALIKDAEAELTGIHDDDLYYPA